MASPQTRPLKPYPLKNWLTYLGERFPIPSYLILSLGFAYSGALLSNSHPNPSRIALATLTLMLFFAELRLMDEFKDYQKDIIAHPERPLPRKLLDLGQVETVILTLFYSMVALGGTVTVMISPIAGLLLLSFTGYLWLMYKEFYVGEQLSRSPFVYAFTHQIIIIPICFFCIAVNDGTMDFNTPAIAYSFSVLGAFFSYEICRKLDPQANPILKTYLSVYGAKTTYAVVFLLLSLSFYWAPEIDAQSFLWPMEFIVGLSLMLVLIKPHRFKVAEAVATLSLIIHIWAMPIQLLIRKYL
jgi:hypothetical protein